MCACICTYTAEVCTVQYIVRRTICSSYRSSLEIWRCPQADPSHQLSPFTFSIPNYPTRHINVRVLGRLYSTLNGTLTSSEMLKLYLKRKLERRKQAPLSRVVLVWSGTSLLFFLFLLLNEPYLLQYWYCGTYAALYCTYRCAPV